MMGEIKAHKILDAIRGMDAVDRELLSDMLINVGKIGMENDTIKEIDRIQQVLSRELGVKITWKQAEIAHREKAKTGKLSIDTRNKIRMGIIR